ncbi:MAG: prenyltransferase/squalene oxidase repeat-containing protein [Limisphaerales bacterium]
MSLRLEMLQVARLAPKLLGESTELVRGFLLSQRNADGGFNDRTGHSDLYYTVFGLDGLIALQAELPVEPVARFLSSFGSGEGLDFVHLCCLARCWAAVASPHPGSTESRPTALWSRATALRASILRRIQNHRAQDRGYNPVAGSEHGTAYGAFLALGAHQDLQADLPEPDRFIRSLDGLKTEDGAWTNERLPHSALRTPPSPAGSTNATAAAVTILRNLGAPIDPAVGNWLLARCHPQGGFLALPGAPMPDLLSTATALHALAGMQIPFARVQDRCLDFVDSLWTNAGGFHGSWGDDHLDCEYTFYALLALGHLSL